MDYVWNSSPSPSPRRASACPQCEPREPRAPRGRPLAPPAPVPPVSIAVAHWTLVGSVLLCIALSLWPSLLSTFNALNIAIGCEDCNLCSVFYFTVCEPANIVYYFHIPNCERLFLCWFMRSGVLEIERSLRRRISPWTAGKGFPKGPHV